MEKFEISTNFMDKYFGKHVEVTIKDGRVVRGKVEWYGEGDDELELCLDSIEVNGKKKDHGMCIPESYVISFTPLEDENTESIFKDV